MATEVTMTVLAGFTEYEAGKRIHRAEGAEIRVSPKRAEHLRANGLARSKPNAKKDSGHED